jgi:hypothetical protein
VGRGERSEEGVKEGKGRRREAEARWKAEVTEDLAAFVAFPLLNLTVHSTAA